MATILTKKLVTKTVKVTPEVGIDGSSPTSLTREFVNPAFVPPNGTIYDTVSVSINGQEILPDSSPTNFPFINSKFYFTLTNNYITNKASLTVFANPKLIEYPYTIDLIAQSYGNPSTYQQHYGQLKTNPAVLQPSALDISSPTFAWFNSTDVITMQYQYELVESVTVTSPSIVTQPNNVTVADGGNTLFTVEAAAPSAYQWQVSSGGSFSSLVESVMYTGVDTDTLHITGATSGMNGYKYRAVVTGVLAPTITSSEATLTVY